MTDETLEPDDETRPPDKETRVFEDDGGTQTLRDGFKTISVHLQEQGIDAEAVDLDASESKGVRAAGDARYTIGQELARGGMGAVLNAKDLNLRRNVAMKVVLDLHAARKDQIVRFVHEAQVTGQLEHPSIVPVYELGVDTNDRVYYTMKYVHGTDLQDILKGIREGDAEMREKYPLARLLNIFVKACDALAFAHAHGVIHRDLKPDNIMVGDFGEVLVVDWGLAKVLGKRDSSSVALAKEDAGENESEEPAEWAVESIRSSYGDGRGMRTMDGSVMGTPAYMSPEQAAGDIENMSPAADIYAMGGILYIMLTLEAPVQGDTLEAILAKAAAGNITPPDAHAGDHPHCPEGKVPPSLSSVVMKAMAREPAARYASAKALQADVQAYLDGFATSTEGASLWRLTKLFLARHRAMAVSVGIALVVITAVILTASVINLKERRAAEAARGRAEIARAEAESEQDRAEVARVEAEAARADAVAALKAFEEEQARSRAVRRTSAPSIVRAAHTLIDGSDLSGAAFQAQLAREYDPELAEAHMLAAQLFMSSESFAEAMQALSEYQALVPGNEHATQLTELCRRAPEMSKQEQTRALAAVFTAQQAWSLAYQLDLHPDETFQLYVQRIKKAWPHYGIKDRFKRRPDGTITVTLSRTPYAELSPLKGMPVGGLDAGGQKKLSDLSPLRGMPIRTLNLHGTSVADLSPLKESPLEELNIAVTRVQNVDALAGLPLKELHLKNVNPRNIKAFKGMPLEYLDLTESRDLRDISPLAGMPLKELILVYCGAQDLTPLSSCTSLRVLKMHWTGATVEDPKYLEPLRGLPLEELVMYARGRRLEALKGMPLKKLKLQTWQDSLDALAGLPLEDLELYASDRLMDIAFLHGMPLKKLLLGGLVNVSDFSPLQGLSLKELRVLACADDADFESIRSLKLLEILLLPEKVNVIDLIDDLPNLKRVGNTKADHKSPPTVAEFRKRVAGKNAQETTEQEK